MSGYLRDVRLKPDRYAWLKGGSSPISVSPGEGGDPDFALLNILDGLRSEGQC